MADPGPKGSKKKKTQSLTRTNGKVPSVPEAKLTPVQSLAAQLLGRGYTRPQVAERLVDYIIQKSRRDRETRLKMARNRIGKWMRKQEFRDAIYDRAVIELDLESPQILKGLSKKAKAGRVDAARFAMELTGRHNPKGEQPTANVQVVFEGVPRPRRHADLELEVEEEEEEED